MSMFAERIADADELRHAPDGDPAYNESSYYNFACADSGVVGWLRVGLQGNRRAGQATAVIFLPTGETLFAFERVRDPDDDVLAAGSLTIEIISPHEEQWLTFDGSAAVLDDGRALTDPKAALTAAPTARTVVYLSVTGLGASFGSGGRDDAHVLERTMSLGHYEQFVHVAGEVQVDGRTYAVNGRGLRDHSWGPRDWAGPLCYRWVTAALDDGSALMALRVTRRDGTTTNNAALYAGGVAREAELLDLATGWTDDGFCREVRCRVACDGAAREYVARAVRPEQFVPLRHRSAGEDGTEQITRIAYAPYTFTCSDGTRGHGPIEVMDLLVGGRPIGMTHG